MLPFLRFTIPFWIFLSPLTAQTPPAATPGTDPPSVAPAVPQIKGLDFLTAPTVEGDPLFFVQAQENGLPAATLLRIPAEPPILRDATGQTQYAPEKDYLWTAGSREIRLPAGSRIPFRTTAQLHPAPGTPNSYQGHRDGGSWMLFGEGRFFHDLQTMASYPTTEVWNAPLPAMAPENQLGTLRRKLKEKGRISLVTLGDSISTGANASGPSGAPPMQPGYPELVALALEERFQAKVRRRNLSVGGMDSAWGLKQIPAVLAETPDLVLLAFGMNDASAKRSTEEFRNLIQETRQRIQQARPGCAVILLSPMTANPEWSHARPELYPAYAEALSRLTGPDTAFADITSLWTRVLERKNVLSLSGNGLNHPNDFGHRLYAAVVLATIGG